MLAEFGHKAALPASVAQAQVAVSPGRLLDCKGRQVHPGSGSAVNLQRRSSFFRERALFAVVAPPGGGAALLAVIPGEGLCGGAQETSGQLV